MSTLGRKRPAAKPARRRPKHPAHRRPGLVDFYQPPPPKLLSAFSPASSQDHVEAKKSVVAPQATQRDSMFRASTLARLSTNDVSFFHSAFKGGFPKTLQVKFPYAENVRLTPSTTQAFYLFRATDLFDPNSTGTGHQPLGFDQYMLFYNHFVVLKSHITVTVVSENEDPKIGAYTFALRLGASTTTYSTISEFMEDPWSHWGYVQAAPYGHHTLKMTYDAQDFYGLDREGLLANPSFWGTVSASPTEAAYWQIALISQNPGTSDAVAAPVFVHIEYEVLLSEPKLLAQS